MAFGAFIIIRNNRYKCTRIIMRLRKCTSNCMNFEKRFTLRVLYISYKHPDYYLLQFSLNICTKWAHIGVHNCEWLRIILDLMFFFLLATALEVKHKQSSHTGLYELVSSKFAHLIPFMLPAKHALYWLATIFEELIYITFMDLGPSETVNALCLKCNFSNSHRHVIHDEITGNCPLKTRHRAIGGPISIGFIETKDAQQQFHSGWI